MVTQPKVYKNFNWNDLKNVLDSQKKLLKITIDTLEKQFIENNDLNNLKEIRFLNSPEFENTYVVVNDKLLNDNSKVFAYRSIHLKYLEQESKTKSPEQ